MDLKSMFINERPQLNNYLKRIGFTLDSVISIEATPVDESLFRYTFKGIGFRFSVETVPEALFDSNQLRFNEAG
ncbi:MAG: hypothetical protein JNM24_17490 [Bdellovibrionaceae bacterium]|nr:hypothetical protein [Pseudobdellovibrionaceae bacterium]